MARLSMAVLLMFSAHALRAQAVGAAAQTKKLKFEVASVKQNVSQDRPRANLSTGPGEFYGNEGNRFAVSGRPLIFYLRFAYNLTDYQQQSLMSQLPAWARTERFDIDARAEGNPTKDQMRTMLMSLLEERFKLAVHHEIRQIPVFGMELAERGKTGAHLGPHAEASPCEKTMSAEATMRTSAPKTGVWPEICGATVEEPSPTGHGLVRIGARRLTMQQIANQLADMGSLDRPVVDRTNTPGYFDFMIEFIPEPDRPQAVDASQSEAWGSSFMTALKEQLGLKLHAQTGPMDTIVVDHVEHPGAN